MNDSTLGIKTTSISTAKGLLNTNKVSLPKPLLHCGKYLFASQQLNQSHIEELAKKRSTVVLAKYQTEDEPGDFTNEHFTLLLTDQDFKLWQSITAEYIIHNVEYCILQVFNFKGKTHYIHYPHENQTNGTKVRGYMEQIRALDIDRDFPDKMKETDNLNPFGRVWATNDGTEVVIAWPCFTDTIYNVNSPDLSVAA